MSPDLRVAEPRHPQMTPWVPAAARIRHIQRELTDTATFALAFDDDTVAQRYRFLPGQFNMLYLPGIGESAISISSDAEEPGALAHTVRFVGNVTQAIRRCQVGDALLVRGPFGSAWPLADCAGSDIVIAAGGLGLAPLRPALYYIARHRQDYGRVYLLYGARSPDSLLYPGEYHAWQAAGIDAVVTVDFGNDQWQGHIGVVPLLFAGLQLTPAHTRVWTCGPEIMMRFVILEALKRRVAGDHIWLSMERNMNCAVGFCGHCQLGPAFVCKDGPVFAFPRMEPYLKLDDL